MSIRLSACTITKNEALNIKRSIDSYKEFVDEIIVVDTGSVDDTVEIAKNAGAKVFNFEWNNDFSAAKNFAIDNCTGDWIIFLDADEWFDKDDAKNIKKAIDETVKAGYSAVSCKLVNFADENEVMEVGCILRIFKHDENIRFERAIHEVLFDRKANVPLQSLYSELMAINHSGYMRKVLKSKAKRNKELLDKAYAEGKSAPIDYFYGVRENLGINNEMSDYFFRLIKNMPDYKEYISNYNIGSVLDENMFKLVSKFSNRYSFEERLEVLKDAQRSFPDNPIFKYYEYNMFFNINRKRAILALSEAVKLSESYEKKHPNEVNSFYAKAGEAFSILGEYELFVGDKTKALDYFVKAVKAEYYNVKALLGILYIIKEQKSEDIVLFLNSIYDINNKEVLKFLTEKLRVTAFHDVFLYYFVSYNKKFNEVDASLFTSRLITKKYDEVIDTYMNVFNESKDSRALVFITGAVICGNRNEKYSEISGSISPNFSKIINAYFSDETLQNVSESEYSLAIDIFKEFAFIADDDTLRKYINVFKNVRERVWLDIVRYYFNYYDYNSVLKVIKWLEGIEFESNDLNTYINYILTNIYFRTGNLEKIEETLDIAVSGGFLDIDLFLICEILEAKDDKLDEYYKLFDAWIEMKKLEGVENFTDTASDSIFFMNVERFCQEIKNNCISGLREQIKQFYDFACKAFNKKAYAYAEKYYKIALKFGYCKEKCYYSLGKIYNYFNKPELSFYCYERAFCENLLLPSLVLPSGHRNYNYVFSKKDESYNTTCPICGKEARAFATYCNIDDINLGYDVPVISTYMRCEDCRHVFLKNDIKDKAFWANMNLPNSNEVRIDKYYDVFEKISMVSDKKRVLLFSEDDYLYEAGKNFGFEIFSYKNKSAERYDIVFAGEYLTKDYELEERMKFMTSRLGQDGILVLNVYDFENLYSKQGDKPLWARVNVKNVFSMYSIDRLLSKYELKVVKIIINSIEKGKVFVVATK